MRWVLGLLAAGCVSTLVGCTALPEVDVGTCGNGVIDEKEACDSPDDPGCGAPGTAEECRFVCTPADDFDTDARLLCPPGMGCGLDGICRVASGTFYQANTPASGSSLVSEVADMDGDFVPDIVAVEPGRIAVHYLDDTGSYVDTASIPAIAARPSVGLLTTPPTNSRDPLDLAVASQGTLSVALGQEGGGLVPKSYAPFTLEEEDRFFVFADVNPGDPGDLAKPRKDGDEPLVFRDDNAGGTVVFDAFDNTKPVQHLVNVDVDAILQPVLVGQLDETTSCSELVIAVKGAGQVSVRRTCHSSGSGTVFDADQAPNEPSTQVDLPGNLTTDVPPLLADVNQDGHQDLVVRASPAGLLVAFGVGDGRFDSKDPLNPTPDNSFAVWFPSETLLNQAPILAVADINRDGVMDFVTGYFEEKVAGKTVPSPGLLIESTVDHPGCAVGLSHPLPPGYSCRAAGNWAEAVVGDFNADPFMDVLATDATTQQLTFLLGTQFPTTVDNAPNTFVIATLGPVDQLRAGDFDGDLLTDVAFRERVGTDEVSMSIAFGQPTGAPVIATRTLGFQEVPQIVAGHLLRQPDNFDGIGDIGIVTEATDEANVTKRFGALVYGRTDRYYDAPIEFQVGDGIALASRALIGKFDSDDHGDLAVLTGPVGGTAGALEPTFQYWFAKGVDEADVDISKLTPSPALAAGSQACMAQISAVDLDGDGLSEVVSVGPKPDQLGSSQITVGKLSGDQFQAVQEGSVPGVVVDALVYQSCITDQISSAVLNQLGLLFVEKIKGELLGQRLTFGRFDGGEGGPDLVFLRSRLDADKIITDPVVVRNVDGALAVDAPIILQHPPEWGRVRAVAPINADADPELELVLVTSSGTRIADVDLDAATLTELPFRIDDSPTNNSVAVGDMNTDGIDDIALGGGNGFWVFLGREEGEK